MCLKISRVGAVPTTAIFKDRETQRKEKMKKRGFATLDKARLVEIARKGGQMAHEKGKAHQWTTEEAREAGKKGGIASGLARHKEVKE
jgi:hypothetical protein